MFTIKNVLKRFIYLLVSFIFMHLGCLMLLHFLTHIIYVHLQSDCVVVANWDAVIYKLRIVKWQFSDMNV